MNKLKLSALGLFILASFTGCGTSPEHKDDVPGKGPSSMIYSPNAEPLNGGPLGTPTCKEALAIWFGHVDQNHDNLISHDEFIADARIQFQRMDIDKNGYLVSEELERFRLPYRQQISSEESRGEQENSDQSGHKHKSSSGDSHRNSENSARSDLPDPVMSADTNNDFKVTPDEFMVQAENKFTALDTNHKGFIDLAEASKFCDISEK